MRWERIRGIDSVSGVAQNILFYTCDMMMAVDGQIIFVMLKSSLIGRLFARMRISPHQKMVQGSVMQFYYHCLLYQGFIRRQCATRLCWERHMSVTKDVFKKRTSSITESTFG